MQPYSAVIWQESVSIEVNDKTPIPFNFTVLGTRPYECIIITSICKHFFLLNLKDTNTFSPPKETSQHALMPVSQAL